MVRKTGKRLKGRNKRRTRRGGQRGGKGLITANNVSNPGEVLSSGKLLVVRSSTAGGIGGGNKKWTWSNNYYNLRDAMKKTVNGGINLRLDESNTSLFRNLRNLEEKKDITSLLDITTGFPQISGNMRNNSNTDKYYVIGFTKENALSDNYSGAKFLLVEAAWLDKDHDDMSTWLQEDKPDETTKASPDHSPNPYTHGQTNNPSGDVSMIPDMEGGRRGSRSKKRKSRKHRRKSQKR